MLKVVEVITKKQQRDFLNFPLQLYKNNPYYVPPIYMDEKKIFNKNYVYNETCDTVYFNAYLDNKMVGRISGIIQKASNEKWNQKRVRFSRFDCIDNQEVANALFCEVEKWAKERQMEEIVGPLGFSDLEREGVLVEGFNELATYEENYNYEYYKVLIENYNFEKEVDWLGNKLYLPEYSNQRLEKYCDAILKRFKLHIAKFKSVNDFIKKYGNQFFEILDITYDKIYGTVPMTKKMKELSIDNFKLVVNVKFMSVIVDENDKVVCFGLCIPSIAKSLQKSRGHLTPTTIFKVLKSIKKPKIIDFGLIGVMPEYAMKGVSSMLLLRIMQMMKENNIEYAETNLTLENNKSILNQWQNFKSIQHKTHRCYVKKIF